MFLSLPEQSRFRTYIRSRLGVRDGECQTLVPFSIHSWYGTNVNRSSSFEAASCFGKLVSENTMLLNDRAGSTVKDLDLASFMAFYGASIVLTMLVVYSILWRGKRRARSVE